ncbi:alpha/beta fold hydrolase [Rhodococcus sp. SGAir0479]|uniref:alpha/beta fold hydrolase n=1 Tax=Rhodococcus sp. SGAir0479 TaxID=2567884 RepID=UPI0010CD28E7|nr:alpha/beta hydrolase [Rhodococcus sp. SGAir0479]QCQ90853.1 alpha/beta fold hydrolase [Rhodococcus sp. SGAir0479]
MLNITGAVAPVGTLPPGSMVELPGRGATYVVDTDAGAGGARDGRPTLVLLHALACTGALTWYPAIEQLARKARVVVLDQRWHGRGIRSDRFTLEDCADDVVALADVLGIDRVVPVGYSMGSLVSQLVWQRHRDRVSGLVLCAAAAHFRRNSRERVALGSLSAGLGALELRPGPVPAGRGHGGSDRAWAYTQFRETSYGAICRATAEIGKFDSTAWVGDIDVPTAVVVPARDLIIPPRRQRWLGRQITGAATYEVDGGHLSCVMNAAAFTEGLSAASASVLARAQR